MPVALPPRLYLLRHGETEWSLSGRHTGKSDIALTEHGAEEARGLAVSLRDVVFTQVWSSPRVRALQTCSLAGLDAQVEIEPNLAEWDYGDYEGLRTPEILQRQPNWKVYRDGCPNGESPAQIAARADAVIARVRGVQGNVALFSHGHFTAALAARWIGLPLEEAEHFQLKTASLSIVGLDPRHPGVPIIELWNYRPL